MHLIASFPSLIAPETLTKCIVRGKRLVTSGEAGRRTGHLGRAQEIQTQLSVRQQHPSARRLETDFETSTACDISPRPTLDAGGHDERTVAGPPREHISAAAPENQGVSDF